MINIWTYFKDLPRPFLRHGLGNFLEIWLLCCCYASLFSFCEGSSESRNKSITYSTKKLFSSLLPTFSCFLSHICSKTNILKAGFGKLLSHIIFYYYFRKKPFFLKWKNSLESFILPIVSFIF